MNERHASSPKETQEGPPPLATRRDFVARGLGLSLLLGSFNACSSLIIEAIIADDPGLSWPKTLDLWMLAIGGKQRTCQEYAELFANAGFSFTRQIDTQAGVSIIEEIPA